MRTVLLPSCTCVSDSYNTTLSYVCLMLCCAKPYACTGDRFYTPRINTVVDLLNYDQCCYAWLHYTLDIYQMNTAELLYTGAQLYRVLTMILQSLKTQTMISEMPSLCHIACASKAYKILSPLLFQQSLYFSLIHRIFYLLVILCSICTYTYNYTYKISIIELASYTVKKGVLV